MPNGSPRSVLVSAPYFLPVIERFRPELERAGLSLIVPPVEERLGETELLSLVGSIHGAICGDDAFTRAVVERAPHLKVIAKWGTGVDSIDLAACAEKGVAVHRTPNAFTDPVADSAIGYALMFIRRLHEMDATVKQGEWRKFKGTSFAECTLGIVGVGDIGQAVAWRAAGFGACILGTDPKAPPAAFARSTGIRMVDLETVLGESDIISLHCDLNPSSRHLIRRETLAQMRPGAFLINTARGGLVSELDLVEALETGRLSGAALDVFEVEPLPAGSRLRGMNSVLLAAHNANASPAAWEAVHRSTVDALLDRLREK